MFACTFDVNVNVQYVLVAGEVAYSTFARDIVAVQKTRSFRKFTYRGVDLGASLVSPHPALALQPLCRHV